MHAFRRDRPADGDAAGGAVGAAANPRRRPGAHLPDALGGCRGRAARDVIRIAAGTCEDCAAWRADRLVIEGEDAERVVIGDRTCLGKGVFVVAANDVTVRGVTLRGARSGDGNGAGIRGEGVNLTVERVRFLHNENGMLRACMRP